MLASRCSACLLFMSIIAAVAAGVADDLVASVAKGDHNAVLQQVGHGTPANDADTKGQLPLVLAVTRADLRTAEVLLNYRASATRVELSSGLSAITAAFKKLNAPMAELLMKFGADPDAADGSGRTGRSLMKKNSKLQELVDRWDSDGAAAFEDAPGSWTKHMHETHAIPFYYSRTTGLSQFMTPPSCAWSKSTLDGHPVYTNSITHQATWIRPPALSWKLLHAPGGSLALDSVEQAPQQNKITTTPVEKHHNRRRVFYRPYWYNYVNDATTTETPAELTNEMAEDLTYDAGSYYHNSVTKEASWEDPKEKGWRAVQDPEGRTFWYHATTGESTWERPAPLAWKPIPTEDGHIYYQNDRTSEVQWEQPVEIAWEKAQFNPHINILS